MNSMAVRGAKARKVAPTEGISGSYDDVEHREKDFEPYDGPDPKPGLYPGKLSKVGQHTTSDDAVVWIFTIDGGQYDGWPGWVYTNGSTAKWKQEQILVALGLMEEGGSVNLTYEQILKKAGPVRLRVQNEEYNDELRPKIRTVLKAASATVASEPEEEEDEPDEDFDDAPKATRAQRRKGKAEPEPEPEDDDEEEDEAEEPASDEAREEREEELEELSAAELKAILKGDHGLKLAAYKGKTEDELREMILELEFPADADEDEEGEGEGVDLEALEEELGELSLAELKKKAKEYGLTLADYRGKSEEEIIDLILTKLEEDGEPPF